MAYMVYLRRGIEEASYQPGVTEYELGQVVTCLLRSTYEVPRLC